MSSDVFIQRELSWNAFNARVLDEGLRKDRLPLDRLKFMAIVSYNYDEFFMTRVARLMRDVSEGDAPLPPGNERPSRLLTELLESIHEVVKQQDACVTEELLPILAEKGLGIVDSADWNDSESSMADGVFETELFPLCSPLALSGERKLGELIAPRRIYALFLVEGGGPAVVRLPDNLNRLVALGEEGGRMGLLDDILLTRGERLFPGRRISARCLFRITRAADMSVDEEQDEDFVAALKEVLESRKSGFPVRLETRGNRDGAELVREHLGLAESHHFSLRSPLDLRVFMKLTGLPGYEHLRVIPPPPKAAEDLDEFDDLWESLQERDILLHRLPKR